MSITTVPSALIVPVPTSVENSWSPLATVVVELALNSNVVALVKVLVPVDSSAPLPPWAVRPRPCELDHRAGRAGGGEDGGPRVGRLGWPVGTALGAGE